MEQFDANFFFSDDNFVGDEGSVHAGIPLNMIQKWLGHARIETTAIYANAVGKEERELAQKMWNISDEGGG